MRLRAVLIASAIAVVLTSAPVATAQNFCMDCIEKQTQHVESDGSIWYEVDAMCCMTPCSGYEDYEMKDEDVGYGCLTQQVSNDLMSGDICMSTSDDQGCLSDGGSGGGGTDDNGDAGECGGGEPGCGSPIVLDLGSDSYRFTSAADGVFFDLRVEGVPQRVAWTRAGVENAFLAMDRNHNGRVDDGSELFGNYTFLRSGERAQHGFEALAELDDNGDATVDARDSAWPALLLWIDRDHDGVSSSLELQRVVDSVVTALQTNHTVVGRRDQWGNLYRYMAHFTLGRAAEPRRAYYDVFFRIAD